MKLTPVLVRVDPGRCGHGGAGQPVREEEEEEEEEDGDQLVEGDPRFQAGEEIFTLRQTS